MYNHFIKDKEHKLMSFAGFIIIISKEIVSLAKSFCTHDEKMDWVRRDVGLPALIVCTDLYGF
jgi:hypothetical protein